MNKTISKDEFIKAVDSLEGAYEDQGLGLYTIAKGEGILNETYKYITTQAKDSDDLDDEFYNLLGRPHPKLVIVDTEEERDRLIEQEKEKHLEN